MKFFHSTKKKKKKSSISHFAWIVYSWMVLSHHKFIILKITFHRLKSSKWSYIFSYDSKISHSEISPPSSSEKFKPGEAVKLLVANAYFLIFSFCLQSLSFIIGNGYRQLLALKWQAHFLHFPGNVWKTHDLSAGCLSGKNCSVREAAGQPICTSTSPETITVFGNAAKGLNVHFPFHPPECLKDTYSRAEILITLDDFNSFVTIIHKWDRLFFLLFVYDNSIPLPLFALKPQQILPQNSNLREKQRLWKYYDLPGSLKGSRGPRSRPWRREWQPTPVFCLGNPWTEEPGGLQSMRSQRVRHKRATNTFTFFQLHLLLDVSQGTDTKSLTELTE